MQDCLYSVCSTSAPPADCKPLDQSLLEMWAINKRKKVGCNGRDRRVKGRKKGRKQEAISISSFQKEEACSTRVPSGYKCDVLGHTGEAALEKRPDFRPSPITHCNKH